LFARYADKNSRGGKQKGGNSATRASLKNVNGVGDRVGDSDSRPLKFSNECVPAIMKFSSTFRAY